MVSCFNSVRGWCLAIVLSCGGSVLVGCGDQAGTESASADRPAWLLESAPGDAIAVASAKASAVEGESIVLRGRIGGRMAPISADSPVFVVMDLDIPHCGQIPGDSCGTPWDYCCETPESITANSATIQVVDAQGKPIEGSPMGHGFSALDEVVVVGTVGPRPTPEVLTIRATGLYRVSAG